MNYIGSKLKLIDFIDTVIHKEVGSIEEKILCDIFSGTGTVAKHFKSKVKKTIANDIEYYSYVLLKNLIQRTNEVESITYLNNIDGVKGFITDEYAIKRKYFSIENAEKIDAIRQEINTIKDEDTYFYALSSLLNAADKIANTASVYAAYLKSIKKSAKKSLALIDGETINGNGVVYQRDANDLIKEIDGDILYLDPPYNHRQYGSNYHVLNTIAEYEIFSPRGISGLPPSYNKSLYCNKSGAFDVLYHLIENANFNFIFLSYNNEGIISKEEIKNLFSKFGKYSEYSIEHKRFKADSNRKYKATKTKESIHCLRK
jgi:adenine-specific DNA-methyltransferase